MNSAIGKVRSQLYGIISLAVMQQFISIHHVQIENVLLAISYRKINYCLSQAINY